jgi:hypothetical protein
MANDARPPAGPGCLGAVIGAVVLVVIVVLVAFVGVVVLAVVAALVVVGLVAYGVDRLLLALSPKRRERRANQTRAVLWQFGQGPGGDVIDVSATESADPAGDADRDRLGPGADGPP